MIRMKRGSKCSIWILLILVFGTYKTVLHIIMEQFPDKKGIIIYDSFIKI